MHKKSGTDFGKRMKSVAVGPEAMAMPAIRQALPAEVTSSQKPVANTQLVFLFYDLC